MVKNTLWVKNGKLRPWPLKKLKILNFIYIESLIHSLISYELKLESKVQDKEEARAKRDIALKVSQEEKNLCSFDDKNVKFDESNVALITKIIEKTLQ